MSLARVVVTAVLVEGRPKAEVARDYHVSRRWVQTLVARYLNEGEAGLNPRSRRPHTSPTRIDDHTETRIVELRKQLLDAGLDAGAHTIAAHLARNGLIPPSTSAIWRILSRRGFVTPQPRKRPKSSYTRFAADQPNETWQTDFTHWQLADATPVEILNFLDDHSRLLLGARAHHTVTGGPAVTTMFTDLITEYGPPASVLSDNGAVFTGRYRHGRNAFQTQLRDLSITQKNSRPYHPQTCGKIERFHQTLKKRLNKLPPATTLADLQQQLDEFRDYYNNQRPHRALNRATPTTAYTARPKATPTGSPLAHHYRLRTDHVDNLGKLTLRHAGKLHHIGIGITHAGTPVRILVHDLHIRVITTDGELLRELTLDPTRDYQPTGARKSRTPQAKETTQGAYDV
ncbi:Transposase [Frankineae bacterium MT45]|nr:Transposase [Frankineae bacterium MT45]